MSTPPEVPGKRESLDSRIEPEERGLIDLAAKVRSIVTSREAYAEFLARLEQPPQPNERLRKTMLTPAPWKTA
ncbi:MAG: DUF1778 domain-containing protein [Pseudomonadota bacterium]|jgi:uncharacterized protein (DUF1778 family)